MYNSSHNPFFISFHIIREWISWLRCILKLVLFYTEEITQRCWRLLYIHAQMLLFISFNFSGLPTSSGSNSTVRAILWVFTNYTEVIQNATLCLPLQSLERLWDFISFCYFQRGPIVLCLPQKSPLIPATLSWACEWFMSWKWANQWLWIKGRKPVPLGGTDPAMQSPVTGIWLITGEESLTVAGMLKPYCSKHFPFITFNSEVTRF